MNGNIIMVAMQLVQHAAMTLGINLLAGAATTGGTSSYSGCSNGACTCPCNDEPVHPNAKTKVFLSYGMSI